MVDEIITVHETSTSRIEDSYGDDTFEDSNQSMAKVSSLVIEKVDNKQSPQRILRQRVFTKEKTECPLMQTNLPSQSKVISL